MNEYYNFYKVYPSIPVELFIIKNRDAFRGQFFRPGDKADFIWFGFDKTDLNNTDSLLNLEDVQKVEKVSLQ